MDGFCREHSGPRSEAKRRPYDDIMRALPRSQAGPDHLARHACAICAYERGWEDARRAIGERLGALIENLPRLGDE